MGTKFIINIGMYQLQSDEMGSDQWKSQVEESSTSSQQIYKHVRSFAWSLNL